MTKEEFALLPPAVALGILFDLVPGLDAVESPELAQSPRYDTKISVGSGEVVYASECALSQLDWYRERSRKSAEGGGQYAEKDQRLLEHLNRWALWRAQNSDACWTGTRGDDDVTAKPPAERPQRYPWDQRFGGQTAPAQAIEPVEEDTSSVPF